LTGSVLGHYLLTTSIDLCYRDVNDSSYCARNISLAGFVVSGAAPIHVNSYGPDHGDRCRPAPIGIRLSTLPPDAGVTGRLDRRRVSALPEADGYCNSCGGAVLFFEGETDARCFNYECGAIVRRLPIDHVALPATTLLGLRPECSRSYTMADTIPFAAHERCERVVPIRVTKLCKTCGSDMTFTGSVLASYPPQYEHICSADASHSPQKFDRSYPAVVFDRCCEGGPQWGHALTCELGHGPIGAPGKTQAIGPSTSSI
jgi:hypothetical protein